MLSSRTLPVLALLFLVGFSAPALAVQPSARAADSTRSGVPPEEATRHYLQGRWLEEVGDADGAVSELTRALALDPSAVGVLLRLSEAASRAGDPSRALELARRAVGIDSTNAHAHWLAGAALFNLEKPSEAVESLARAARIDSLDANYQRTLARAADAADQPALAQRAWERAARLDGDDGESWFQLATLYARSGRFPEADSALGIATELNPARPGSLFLRGFIRENLGDLETAIAAYQHHLGVHDNDQGTRRRLVMLLDRAHRTADAYREAQIVARARPKDAEAQQTEAELAYDLKRAEDGRRALERMRALDPDDPGLLMRSVTTLTRADRGKEAVELARRWTSARESDPRARLIVARAYAMAGQLDSAAAISRREITAAPDSVEPRRLLARILQDRKQWADAISEWRAVRALRGDDPALLLDLGICLEQSGDIDGAVKAGRDALALVPEAGPALNFLGYLLADHERDLVEAERLVHRALLQDPDNGAYVDSWGWVLFRLGRLEEARAALERAVELTGGDAVVHEHLGDVYAALKMVEPARKQYRASLATESPNSRVRSKLEALR